DADNTLPWRPAAGEAGRISGYQPNGVAGGGADRRSAGPPVVGEGILCAGYAPWRRYRRFPRHLADHRRTSNGTGAAGRGVFGQALSAADAGVDLARAVPRSAARRAPVLGSSVRLVCRAGGRAAVARSCSWQRLCAQPLASGRLGNGGSTLG